MSDFTDQELPIPTEASLLGGQEVLRAFVVRDDLHVSLANAFDQPDVWGVLLVDIAGHVADMYAAKSGMQRDKALADIRKSFDDEWARVLALTPSGPGA
jgi:thiamine biosynthesis protein ThiC